MASEQMGNYEVVSDTRTPETSLRLLRVWTGHEVQPHYHRRATQVYVVLTGSVRIRLGDGALDARPLEMVRVPPLTVHALSARESSLVLSITVPPLEPDDQHPAGPAAREGRRDQYFGK
jgi:mannose-6-phosphate isomerase-like protein (cupin superfamily)